MKALVARRNSMDTVIRAVTDLKINMKDIIIALLVLFAAISVSYNLKLSNKLEIIEGKYFTMLEERNTLADSIEGLNTAMKEMESQNKELLATNELYREEAQQLRECKEFMDKYEFAIYDTSGNRTDISYDQLKTAEQAAAEQGIDVNYLLATIMVESNGDSTSSSTSSTAKGYGQFLQGTGKFVYEKLLGHGAGTYNHNMALNGETNIKMMAAYMGYLKNKNTTIYSAINQYRGLSSPGYTAKINEYLHKAGTSLEQINSSYNS